MLGRAILIVERDVELGGRLRATNSDRKSLIAEIESKLSRTGLKHDALDIHVFFHMALEIWKRKEEMLTLQVEMNAFVCAL